MQEKKAKRTRKVKKVAISPILERAKTIDLPDAKLEFDIGDEKYCVSIKQHVDFAARSAIMDNIANIYFPVGVFDPMYGDELLDLLIIQMYTDLEFSDDFDAFDSFIHKMPDVYSEIINAMPYEVRHLRDSIESSLDKMVAERSISVEQKLFYENASSFVSALKDVAESLIGVLETAEKSMEGINMDDMKDLISAMSHMGKTDDARIAKAVLDFQKEKEKRIPVKAESDEHIPHI